MLQRAALGWKSHRITTVCQLLPSARQHHVQEWCWEWGTELRAVLRSCSTAHGQHWMWPPGMGMVGEPTAGTQQGAVLLSAANVTAYMQAARL